MKRWTRWVSVCLGLSAAGCVAEPVGEPGIEVTDEIDGTGVAELGGSSGQCGTTVLFDEDFADNAAGWTLGTGWQIGPATTSTCQTAGSPDPSSDHTPTAGNGVAGVYIGGCPPLAASTFPYHSMTSPPINADVNGSVNLSFWRWLNTTGRNHVKIEVFDGAAWVMLYQSPLGVTGNVLDSSWKNLTYDLTPYRNPNLRVRFSWRVVVYYGGWYTSGWNLDDLQVTTEVCP